jgi:hypothetical protein
MYRFMDPPELIASRRNALVLFRMLCIARVVCESALRYLHGESVTAGRTEKKGKVIFSGFFFRARSLQLRRKGGLTLQSQAVSRRPQRNKPRPPEVDADELYPRAADAKSVGPFGVATIIQYATFFSSVGAIPERAPARPAADRDHIELFGHEEWFQGN